MVHLVDVEAVRPLRGLVLRPGQAAEASIYPGDDDPRAAHAAVVDGTRTLAVGSVLVEDPPWTAPDAASSSATPATPATPAAWRIRGMATVEDRRGEGLGRQVLDALLAHVLGHSGQAPTVWCQARVGARTFYERAGFAVLDGPFDLPGIGPHYSMARTLD